MHRISVTSFGRKSAILKDTEAGVCATSGESILYCSRCHTNSVVHHNAYTIIYIRCCAAPIGNGTLPLVDTNRTAPESGKERPIGGCVNQPGKMYPFGCHKSDSGSATESIKAFPFGWRTLAKLDKCKQDNLVCAPPLPPQPN